MHAVLPCFAFPVRRFYSRILSTPHHAYNQTEHTNTERCCVESDSYRNFRQMCIFATQLGPDGDCVYSHIYICNFHLQFFIYVTPCSTVGGQLHLFFSVYPSLSFAQIRIRSFFSYIRVSIALSQFRIPLSYMCLAAVLRESDLFYNRGDCLSLIMRLMKHIHSPTDVLFVIVVKVQGKFEQANSVPVAHICDELKFNLSFSQAPMEKMC